MAQSTEDALFLNEQRRFRRLEASLPVWVGRESDLKAGAATEGTSPWSLGYTRDLSMGGAKVIVSPSEAAKWRAAVAAGDMCLLRFDVPGQDEDEVEEYITARVRNADHDRGQGHFWLGVQYEEGARNAKAAAMKAGLATMNRRKRWQGAFVLALVLVGALAVGFNQQIKETAKERALKAQANAQRAKLNKQLSALARAAPGSRAESIALASQRRDAKARLAALSSIAKFSKEGNESEGEAARRQKLLDDGLTVSAAPAGNANVELGVALPFGYAWPVVVSALEDETLRRRVPTIVVFRDFKGAFPIEDAREARVRAKTLQVTWEPWLFSNPNAVKLSDVANGKYDAYLDSWARSARSFGAEVWIRWAHEFNGDWYPWSIGSKKTDAKTYIAAFRRVRDRFNRIGASNVRWIWCINAESVPDTDWNDPAKAYPGDAYVDMISIDGYNFGTAAPGSRWLSFREIYGRPYAQMTKLFPNKPIMIGEIGCADVGGDKVAWLKDMDKQLRGRFSRIQGLVWFEAEKEADWRLVSSPEVQATARAIFSQPHYRRGES